MVMESETRLDVDAQNAGITDTPSSEQTTVQPATQQSAEQAEAQQPVRRSTRQARAPNRLIEEEM